MSNYKHLHKKHGYHIMVADDLSADNVLNANIIERLGSKSDAAAAGAVTTTDTLMAYIKQLVQQGKRIVTATSVSPLASGDIFTCSGLVLIYELIGRVTTIVEAQATTIKLTFDPDTGGANVSLDAGTLDLNGKAVGTIIRCTFDFSDALLAGGGDDIIESDTHEARPLIIGMGDILTTFGAASTGAIEWSVLYESLGGEILAS